MEKIGILLSLLCITLCTGCAHLQSAFEKLEDFLLNPFFNDDNSYCVDGVIHTQAYDIRLDEKFDNMTEE